MRLMVWVGILALVATYGVYAFTSVDRHSDEVQIRSLISDALGAVQKQDLSGAMQCVSKDYKDDSGLDFDHLRIVVAQALRSGSGFSTSANIERVAITEKTAQVRLHAEVNAQSWKVPYSCNLTLVFTKEHSTRALFIPAEAWRVTSSSGLGLDLAM